jgi:hypothetical protein
VGMLRRRIGHGEQEFRKGFAFFFFTVKNRKGFTCVKKRVFYFGKN